MKINTDKIFQGSLFLVAVFPFMLSACGGGGAPGSGPAGVFTFTIGGAISGLTGTGVLQNNLGDNLTVSGNGNFTFATPVTSGKNYNVTVLTQPAGQTCSVSTGVGTVSSSNVVNVAVVCSKDAYTVSGTVTGLTGTAVLQNNNGDNLIVDADGTYIFPSKVAFGSPYSVTVLTQPTGQTCTVSTGSGTVSSSNVNNVAVTCSSNAFNVGGTVTGLTGTAVLQNNSGDNLIVTSDSNFTFATKVAFGSPYSVTVLTHPAGQSCSVASGTGTMGIANVTNVAITCANTYTVGGTVSLLNGSMVLQNNATGNHTVSVNGPFTFPTTLTYGGSYNVSVLTHPTNQRCLVANGTGNATANVSNVNLSCASQMGGAMQGIALNLAPMVNTFSTGFNNPYGITSDGTNLYVADYGNNMIRKIVIASGVVTTLAGTGAAGSADGPGATATFNSPNGITTDGANLYVTEFFGGKIRKIVIATGVVSSLTGVANAGMWGSADGPGDAATFYLPQGITTDGTNLYVADFGNQKIRKIVIATGFVSSFTGVANTTGVPGAGDGAGAAATFNDPRGITTDGTNLYVTDSFNNKIRKIVIATGVVSSFTGLTNTAGVAGAIDGASAVASFDYPEYITTDGTNLYVVDTYNHKIRKIVIATGVVSSLTGVTNTVGVAGATDGAGAAATFNYPMGITTDGSNLFVADQNNNIIRKIQ